MRRLIQISSVRLVGQRSVEIHLRNGATVGDINEDRVYRIVSSVVSDHEKIDLQRYEELKKGRDENRDILSAQNVVLSKIETKVDAIYGNGSGRIGILDEMKDTQKEVKTALDTSQKEVKIAFDDAEEKASNFRHDVRDQFEKLNLALVKQQIEKTVTTQTETRYGKKIAYVATWVKWLIGGTVFMAWRIVEIKYFAK